MRSSHFIDAILIDRFESWIKISSSTATRVSKSCTTAEKSKTATTTPSTASTNAGKLIAIQRRVAPMLRCPLLGDELSSKCHIFQGPTIGKQDTGFGNSGSGFANFADFDNKVRNLPTKLHIGKSPSWNW